MKVYVGPKQATIENNNYFDYSITLVGNNINNISLNDRLPFDYWNPDNNRKEIEFYNNQLAKISDTVEIIAHNPHLFSQCTFNKNVHFLCQNDKSLLDLLDDKIQTRQLLNGLVPMLKYENLTGKQFLKSRHNYDGKDIVIQSPYGSGGSRTYIYNEKNKKKILKLMDKNEEYSISEYQENNIPYNVHCIIGEKDIEILSPSQQDIEITEKIEYIGSFFVIKMTNDAKQKMIEYSNKICKKIQNMGYRGVLGIDWIYTRGELFFIEINPRFQGSTRQVDLLLKKSGLPSIFELNFMAFDKRKLPSTKKMLFSLYEND